MATIDHDVWDIPWFIPWSVKHLLFYQLCLISSDFWNVVHNLNIPCLPLVFLIIIDWITDSELLDKSKSLNTCCSLRAKLKAFALTQLGHLCLSFPFYSCLRWFSTKKDIWVNKHWGSSREMVIQRTRVAESSVMFWHQLGWVQSWISVHCDLPPNTDTTYTSTQFL